MIKCYNFIQRLLRAQRCLLEFSKLNKRVFAKKLKNLDRNKMGLNLNLSKQEVLIDYFAEKFEKSDENVAYDKERNILKESNIESEDNKISLEHLLHLNLKNHANNPLTNVIEYAPSELNPTEDETDVIGTFETVLYNVKEENRSNSDLETKEVWSDSSDEPLASVIKRNKLKNNKNTKSQGKTFDVFNDVTEEMLPRTTRIKKLIDYSQIDGPEDSEPDKVKKVPDDSDFILTSSSEEIESYSIDRNTNKHIYRYYYDSKRIKKPKDTRVYPMKCENCDYEVPVKSMHFKHYLYVHPDITFPYSLKKEFICQFCGIAKSHLSKLQLHETMHGSKTVECPDCDKKFHNKERLRQHKRYHGNSQYFCDYCGKAFKTRGDIQVHLRIHTNEKPYKCHICGAGFAHNGNRAIHIRTNHQHEPRRKQIKRVKRSRKQRLSTNSDTDEYETPLKKISLKRKKNLRK